MQVAHRSYVVSMLDGDALREIVEKEKPDYIVPEVEAIATQTLMELEKEGFLVIAGKVPRRYFEKRWYGFSV